MHADTFELLAEDYARSLGDLYRAGLAMIRQAAVPQWFHAQRVVVAIARSRLASLDPGRREAAREQEAHILLRLRDDANRAAKMVRATTRPLKRRRRALEDNARTWEEQAEQLIHGEAN